MSLKEFYAIGCQLKIMFYCKNNDLKYNLFCEQEILYFEIMYIPMNRTFQMSFLDNFILSLNRDVLSVICRRFTKVLKLVICSFMSSLQCF